MSFSKIFYLYAYREDEEQTNILRKTEKKTIDEVLPTSISSNRNRTLKSPIVTQLPPPVPTGGLDNSNKRRTTRRTTIRLLQESQNGKNIDYYSSLFYKYSLVSQTIELPTKTRYPTRYSTRLAGTMINEESTTTIINHRTARLTSE